MPRPSAEPGRWAYDGLDRVLHEKARLGILTSLTARPEGLSFNELKAGCALTDGNLSRHLQVLAECGYVELRKDQGRGRSHTRCRLTPLGRRRFLGYLAELEKVIQDAVAATPRGIRVRRGEPGLPPGWVPA